MTRRTRRLVARLLPLLALSATIAAGKEKPDPVNRIFLVGDRAGWIDTGLDVRPQDQLTIRAGSEVCFAGADERSCVRADGWPRESYAETFPADAAACADPFPEWAHGSLVALVGDDPIPVGRQTVVRDREGRVRLGINDCSFEGALANRGQFSVVMVIENPTAHAARSGRELIEEAIEALGGDAVDGVKSLRARAQCTGPGGRFTTEVVTLEPDQTLFKQTSDAGSAEWLAQGDRAWKIDRATGARQPAKKMLRVIRGHEFHDLLFDLDERFQDHTLPVAEAEGDEASAEPDGCLRVEMRDPYGAPAAVCLEPETFLPVTLTLQPAGKKREPPIEIQLERWLEIDGVQFLEAFTLRQGDEVFTYEYDQLLPNSVSRASFSAVSERAMREIRKRNKQHESGDPEAAAEDPTEEPVDDATGR